MESSKALFTLIITFFILSCGGCSNKNVNYLSSSEPFRIKKGEKNIRIPNNLKPTSFNDGLLLINYFVDHKGHIDGVNIGLLRLKDSEGNKLIWYQNSELEPMEIEEYPNDIKPFLNWVKEYSKTRLIETIYEPKSGTKWKVSILLRLE